jgi:prepilin-type N-terminal cleavage/methylation domain-containing protein
MRTRNKSAQKGFTLIELLVVVAIIGLLSSVVLSSLSNSRLKAADAKVMQEKRSVQLAVQLYITQNGRFPNTGDTNFHCLASTPCVYAGTTYQPSDDTALASLMIPSQESESKKFAFINKAEAFLGGFLPSRPTVNPLVSPTGSGTYSGPFYKCGDSSCNTAIIIFTTNKPVSGLSGSVRNSLTGSGGTVYQQSAEGSLDSTTY